MIPLAPFRCVLATLVLASMSASAVAQPYTAFDRAIATLQQAPDERRAEFASLALAQLAEAYLTESNLAQTDPAASRVKRTRWPREVERYAHDLLFLKLDVERGMAVALEVLPATGTVLTVGGQQVVLTHPRPSRQAAFEESLLASFCQQHECDALLAEEVPATAEVIPEAVEPEWSFTEDGIVCSHGGLEFQFALDENSGSLRQLCGLLFLEIENLVAELKALQTFGVLIDWQHLALERTQQASEYSVILNAAGDVVLLRLPNLYDRPKLLPLLRPWLAANANGESATLSLSATEFGDSQ